MLFSPARSGRWSVSTPATQELSIFQTSRHASSCCPPPLSIATPLVSLSSPLFRACGSAPFCWDCRPAQGDFLGVHPFLAQSLFCLPHCLPQHDFLPFILVLKIEKVIEPSAQT